MPRLIDANALISQYPKNVFTAQIDYAQGMRDVIDDIQNAPTVDAVEVVHGRWEFSHTTTVEKYDVVKCSNCGHEAFAIANYVKYGHYCPNCGAKMDGDGNERA